MANLDIQSTQLGQTEIRPASVPGEVTVSDDVIDNLKLPKDISRNEIMSFLALQSARLRAVEERPPVKAMQASIPPPDDNMFAFTDDDVTVEEMQALDDFTEDLRVQIQSGEEGATSFTDAANDILGELRQRAPRPEAGDTGIVGGDFFTMFMTAEAQREWSAKEQEYRELIAQLLADPKADSSAVILLLGEMLNERANIGLQSVFSQFRSGQEQYQQNLAAFDLSENPSAGELFQAQNEMSQHQTDIQMHMQGLQMGMQEVQTAQTRTKSLLDTDHSTRQHIIRNTVAT